MSSLLTSSISPCLLLSLLAGSVSAETSPPEPALKISWKDGRTTLATKSAEIKLSNRLQLRLTQLEPEVGEGNGSFRIRRAKTKFEGWVYRPELTFEVQLSWADSGSPLEDAAINYDLSHGKKAFQIRAGQFKVPFGRQELTSENSQQFVDRAAVSNFFARSRDLGIMVHGLTAGGKIDWRVGLFNGGGRNRTSNDNDKYQLNARLSFEPFGEVKYSEGDFESSVRPLFGVALQYESNDSHGATVGDDNDREIVGTDLTFKYRGFSAFAELFEATNDPEAAATFDSSGLTIQVGHFVLKERLEVALRYSILDPTSLRGNDERTESGLGFSYFWNKHNHKIQADLRELEDRRSEQSDRELRVQYQLIF